MNRPGSDRGRLRRPFPLNAPPDRRQVDDWSCGLVTAGVCLELIGWPPRLADDRAADLVATPIDGTDPRSLESLFRRLRLPVVAGEMDWADLAYHTGRGRPVACLVRLDGSGHWVAVWSASSRRVRWHCPTNGPSEASPAAFRRGWWDWDRAGVDYRCWGVAVGPDRKGS